MITPAVISVVPSNNATDVQLNPAIFIVFNTDIAKDTVNSRNILLSVGSTYVQLDIVYHPLNRTAEVHTLSALDPNSVYTLTVVGDDFITGTQVDGVTDILGNPMIGNFTSVFTTGVDAGTPYDPNPDPFPAPDPGDIVIAVPLEIENITPGFNASNISSNKIVIKFNSEIDPTTVNQNNIFMVRSDNS